MVSEKEKQRREKIKKNHPKYWLGKKRSKETRQKMSLAAKKKERIEISIKNLPKYKKGESPLIGTKLSKERISKLKTFKKGHIPWNKGKKQFIPEEKHYEWKGDAVGYVGLHNWVKKHLENPMECEHCGKVGKNNRQIHWANKSHEYKRELTDWIRLCVKCHKSYDKK